MRMPAPALLATLAATALLAGCATQHPGAQRFPDQRPMVQELPTRCDQCGRIEHIARVLDGRATTRTGAVLGGVVGAIAGRELADDASQGRQNTATVAGAVAGALAGDAIENRMNAETFEITVRMDDGRRLTVQTTRLAPGLGLGSAVRWNGRELIPLR